MVYCLQLTRRKWENKCFLTQVQNGMIPSKDLYSIKVLWQTSNKKENYIEFNFPDFKIELNCGDRIFQLSMCHHILKSRKWFLFNYSNKG